MRRAQAFPAQPGSIKAARTFAQEQLATVDPALVSSIVLMVSELSTNSVRHARTEFTVDIDASDAEVRITVTDAGPGDPEMRSPADDDPSGRGLRIVERLADAWGIDDGVPGKSVWFVVRLDAEDRGGGAGDADRPAAPTPVRGDSTPQSGGGPKSLGRLDLAA